MDGGKPTRPRRRKASYPRAKRWRDFEEAREYARSLGLNGSRGWQEYCKSGQKPGDIPARPEHVYAEDWSDYRDWLGTGARYSWLPFEQAREYVRGLKLKNSKEWREYCRSGQKPD